jgi:hypothetical protein
MIYLVSTPVARITITESQKGGILMMMCCSAGVDPAQFERRVGAKGWIRAKQFDGLLLCLLGECDSSRVCVPAEDPKSLSYLLVLC